MYQLKNQSAQKEKKLHVVIKMENALVMELMLGAVTTNFIVPVISNCIVSNREVSLVHTISDMIPTKITQ